MKLQEVMTALAAVGTAQNRKVYARHGAREPMFGVGYAALYRVQKQLGVDHALALQLWNTGNHDARVLATLIADPKALDEATLERWLADARGRSLWMAFSSLAGRSPVARSLAPRWIEAAEDEWRCATGWATLAGLATDPAADDAELAKLLPRIEKTIHHLPNYARHAMNHCLIALGSRPALREPAMAVARKVGAVEVDHGDTSCQTPVASEYIARLAARAKAGKPKAASRKPAPRPRKAPPAAGKGRRAASAREPG